MADDDDSDLTRPAPSNAETGIIRRHPTGEHPVGEEPQTNIIRRRPTGPNPIADPPTQVTDLGPTQLSDQAQTGYIPRARPMAVAPTQPAPPSPKTAITAAVMSILSGWATAVIATDLITGWWRSDPLFCVAVGFLTAISAAALIAGLIGLLLRRRLSRLLIMVGAVIALLIFSSLFVAGAKLPTAVYAIPVFPVATIVLAALPATGRWERSG
ncbi:hypothetical protein ABQF17_16385 [Mycolicibacterium elephantis]|uniref:Uncharacterized protein n=1 Tax=Mycolicibacterium elephantis TaxID=81858 RepID=A0A1X0DAV5_9MYCO|nr:hypothetical protein [Mycolicibacterium elephantis]OBE98258.1 hypothetical protein A5776_14670 [Mycolicibacterium elephantis]ORA69302.1 hypothetical protein BST23_01205 [Mycolicibacterium elephantis]